MALHYILQITRTIFTRHLWSADTVCGGCLTPHSRTSERLPGGVVTGGVDFRSPAHSQHGTSPVPATSAPAPAPAPAPPSPAHAAAATDQCLLSTVQRGTASTLCEQCPLVGARVFCGDDSIAGRGSSGRAGRRWRLGGRRLWKGHAEWRNFQRAGEPASGGGSQEERGAGGPTEPNGMFPLRATE